MADAQDDQSITSLVSLAEIRAWCGIAADFTSDDALLMELGEAATDAIGRQIGVPMPPTQLDIQLPENWDGEPVVTRSTTAIVTTAVLSYFDSANEYRHITISNDETWSFHEVIADGGVVVGWRLVAPAGFVAGIRAGQNPPRDYERRWRIRIKHGLDLRDVPMLYKQTARHLVFSMYNDRGVGAVPNSTFVDRLLALLDQRRFTA